MNRSQIEERRQENPFLSLSDILYDIILQDIISFKLKPGTRLNESSIAEQLGTGRSPVKSALLRLYYDSYVVKNPGYRVVDFSVEEYRDLWEFSDLIEPYAASRVALRANTEELDRLYQIAFEMQDICGVGDVSLIRKNYERIMVLEYKFHSSIINLSQHALVQTVYAAIKSRLSRYRRYLNYDPPEGYFDVVGKEHVLICNVLKLHDADMAKAVMHRHLIAARREVYKRFATDKEKMNLRTIDLENKKKQNQ